jgi:hypothetical protein
MHVLKAGSGQCPDCGGHQDYRYLLLDVTGTGQGRLDRLWLCPVYHRETDVDMTRYRDAG